MEKICHWLLIVGNRRFGLIKPSSVKWKRKYAIEYDSEKSGIVYKISCTQCNFVYYGQTERSIKYPNCGAQKGSGKFWPEL